MFNLRYYALSVDQQTRYLPEKKKKFVVSYMFTNIMLVIKYYKNLINFIYISEHLQAR